MSAVEGTTATITAAGVYRLSGSLDDGQIVVETEDEGTVELILDNATITKQQQRADFRKQRQGSHHHPCGQQQQHRL